MYCKVYKSERKEIETREASSKLNLSSRKKEIATDGVRTYNKIMIFSSHDSYSVLTLSFLLVFGISHLV
jgi:hypothetical protein